MITTSYKLTRFFFDRAEVRQQLGVQRARFLNRVGGYARKTAIRSQRRVGKKGLPSPPGQPPRHHGVDPSLRTILYGMSPSGGVIVGPVGFNQQYHFGGKPSAGTIPALHEVGGTLGIREKLVSTGEFTYGAQTRNAKGQYGAKEKIYGKRWVPVGRRKPRPGQPTRVRTATYPARPTMKPAQEKTIAKFPQLLYGRDAAGALEA